MSKVKIENSVENHELRRMAANWLISVGYKSVIKESTTDRRLFFSFFDYFGLKPPKGTYARKLIVKKFLLCGFMTKRAFIDSIHNYYDETGNARMEIVSNNHKNQRVEHDYNRLIISNTPSKTFYQSKEWKALRYQVISENGNRCMCCGVSPKDGAIIQVDHIKPRSVYPEFALNKDNLQVLCRDCNMSKSNTDQTDWR